MLEADSPDATAREYLRAARAARALHSIDDASSFFKDAIALAPADVKVNTEWGDLFLEKYDKANAVKSYQEALKVDPEYGPALLGMARALQDENPPQAITFALYLRRARRFAGSIACSSSTPGTSRRCR